MHDNLMAMQNQSTKLHKSNYQSFNDFSFQTNELNR